MKFFALLICAVLSVAVAQTIVTQPPVSSTAPAAPPASPTASLPTPPAPLPPQHLPTLAQDLQELKRMLPMKEIGHLVRRYLLNDAEFQGVVRTINSYDAFMAMMRLKSQPEVLGFNVWVRTQLRLSGGGESNEDESDEMHLMNKSPFWSNSVYGWQGFVNEFMIYYPEFALRTHIQMKVQQGGSFAEYWRRVQGLRVVFDRFIAFPETQRVIAQLQEHGVDTVQMETFIRNQFGWQVMNPSAAVTPAQPPMA